MTVGRRPSLPFKVAASLLAAALGLSARAGSAPVGGVRPVVRLKVLFFRLSSFAPLAIARDEGYFREQGLDVELVEIPALGDGTPALIRGDIDVGAGIIRIADFNAIARGAILRIVADKGHVEAGPCASSGLVAHRSFLKAKNPERAEHLRGARVSAPPLSLAEYGIETFLASRGLRLADLTVIKLQQAMAAEAVAQGSIDFATLTEPDLSRALKSGKAVLWKPAQEILPGAQIAAITFGRRLLEKNRDAGRRFMVAYLRGVRQYGRGRTPRNLEILAKATGLDRDLLAESCWQPIRGDGLVNTAALVSFQEWAARKGALDVVLPPERFWDPSFVEAANRALGPTAR